MIEGNHLAWTISVQSTELTRREAVRYAGAVKKKAQDARIEIRCRADEKQTLQDAADRDHRPLSTWLLVVGLEKAKKDGGGPEPAA